MYYLKTDDFDQFRCTSSACKLSCCIGWQIVIDENSLVKYKTLEGSFAPRLSSSIDWTEGVFLQNDKRCAMLNDNGLCDLQSACGESSLCNTCRDFPRHMEEYDDLQEYFLSFSCPEVAKALTVRKEPMTFVQWEEDIEDDLEENLEDESEIDFRDDLVEGLENESEWDDDFDFFLFDKLSAAREQMLRTAQNRELPLTMRMDMLLSLAHELQELLDNDQIFEMDECMDQFSADSAQFLQQSSLSSVLANASWDIPLFEKLQELEMLDGHWKAHLEQAFTYIQGFRSAAADACLLSIPAETNACTLSIPVAYEVAGEHFLVQLLLMYFCSAVYDNRIYARTALAVCSVRWIFRLFASHAPAEQTPEVLADLACRYAREIEHSDINVGTLFDMFEEAHL